MGGHFALEKRLRFLSDSECIGPNGLPSTRARSQILVHYVVDEIRVQHVYRQPVSSQCDKRMLLGSILSGSNRVRHVLISTAMRGALLLLNLPDRISECRQ